MSVRLKVTKRDDAQEELEIEWSKVDDGFHIINEEIAAIDLSPISSYTTLKTLSIYDSWLSSIGLTPLTSCTSLRELHVSKNYLDSIDLPPLYACTDLVTITPQNRNSPCSLFIDFNHWKS